MKKLLLALLLCCSCAGWRGTANKTIGYSREAMVLARDIMQPEFLSKCVKLAQACKDKGGTKATCTAEGTPLAKCEKSATLADAILRSVGFGLLDAQLAVAVSQEEEAEAILQRVGELLGELRGQLGELSDEFR